MDARRAGACDELASLHRTIDQRVLEFSTLLIAARRDSPDLERLLGVLGDIQRLLAISADAEEAFLFPPLEAWLGGANGPLDRARRAHEQLRLRFRDYWASTERLLFAPPSDRAERRILVHRGHELIAAIEETLGLEDEYIFRFAERVLGEVRAAEVARQIGLKIGQSMSPGLVRLAKAASA